MSDQRAPSGSRFRLLEHVTAVVLLLVVEGRSV